MSQADMNRGDTSDGKFEQLLAEDRRKERRIFWAEIALLVFLAALVLAYVRMH